MQTAVIVTGEFSGFLLNLEDFVEKNYYFTYYTITPANIQDYFSCRHVS